MMAIDDQRSAVNRTGFSCWTFQVQTFQRKFVCAHQLQWQIEMKEVLQEKELHGRIQKVFQFVRRYWSDFNFLGGFV